MGTIWSKPMGNPKHIWDELVMGSALPHISQNILERLRQTDIRTCQETSPSAFAICNQAAIRGKLAEHNLSRTRLEDTYGLETVLEVVLEEQYTVEKVSVILSLKLATSSTE